MARRPKQTKEVAALTHEEASRKNIPTAEYQSMLEEDDRDPIQVAYKRRNPDLDPQLVWRGKDMQDWSDLVVPAPPLFIQEKVQPKALIDALREATKECAAAEDGGTPDLFADFNGLPDGAAKTEFYQHDANWANRMILGDSLQVMASLAEREGLRGKVQCIYIDPPYGIKFNSNFQWSTTSRNVKDGKAEHITREPEQVKAFRDTWRDGIHSYLTYLRDRLTVARDLLTESGSVFVQIGDENVHRVRAVMDEVFGEDNFASIISIRKTTSEGASLIGSTTDFVLWYGKSIEQTKSKSIYTERSATAEGRYTLIGEDGRRFRLDNMTSSRPAGSGDVTSFVWRGQSFTPGGGTFKTTETGLARLGLANRLVASSKGKLNYVRFQDDFGVAIVGNLWADISGAVQSRSDPKVYVVQTSTQLIERCLLLATDPGDLVLDPTCGSGTTAYVAEQWGRRWITIDTSRVALALARQRIMAARYPYYLLADSPGGKAKEAELAGRVPETKPTYGSVRQGFVYERVPHITLRAIANNAEIDVIWEAHQTKLEPLRERLNQTLKQAWQEWEIPRYAEDPWAPEAQALHAKLQAQREEAPQDAQAAQRLLDDLNATLKRRYRPDTLPPRPADPWPKEAADLHAAWWAQRIARQREIDASIAAKADYEYLYDKPFEDKRRVRVAGPFTMESLSPHRVLAADEDDELAAEVADERATYQLDAAKEAPGFAATILENLRTAGVQQAAKADRIVFTALQRWPGTFICAEGCYIEGGADDGNTGEGAEKRAAIFIGPEFGTVTRPDLVDAAREAAEANFDVLIGCAFNYDAQTSDLAKLGRLPVLKARMNADLHMAEDLKNTGKGNLFVIFGEPDIDILPAEAGGTSPPPPPRD